MPRKPVEERFEHSIKRKQRQKTYHPWYANSATIFSVITAHVNYFQSANRRAQCLHKTASVLLFKMHTDRASIEIQMVYANNYIII